MGIKHKNKDRTVFERESTKGTKHLVVRRNKEAKEPGEEFDRKMKKAGNKFKI